MHEREEQRDRGCVGGKDTKSRAEGRGWQAKSLAKAGEQHSQDSNGRFLASALVILLEGSIPTTAKFG
jgi:hypothetical protein